MSTNEEARNQPANGRTSKVRAAKKRRFTWKRGLLAVILILCGFLFWTVRTNNGSDWLLRTVMSQIDGHVGEIKGNIWSGVDINSLNVDTFSFKLVAHDVRLEVDWLKLLQAKLHVKNIRANELSLELFPIKAPVEQDQSETDLSIPIAIEVERASFGKFNLHNTQEGALPLELVDFNARDFVLKNGGVKADLQNLKVQNRDISSQLSGQITLNKLASPWPLDIQLQTSTIGLNTQSAVCVDYLLGRTGQTKLPAQCKFNLNINAHGDLNNLKIKVNGSGQNSQLDGLVHLDLSAPLPINQANISLNVADRMRLKSVISKSEKANGASQLNGTIKVNNFVLNRLNPNSRVSGDFDFATAISNAKTIDNVQLSGRVLSDSQWHAKKLKGTLDIEADLRDVFAKETMREGESNTRAVDDQKMLHVVNKFAAWHKIKLNKADLDFSLGDNQITVKGALAQAADSLILNTKSKDLSQIWPDLQGKLLADIKVQGTAAKHALTAKLNFDQGGQPQELGVAPIAAELKLKGDLNVKNELYAWIGDATGLKLSHAGFEMDQQSKPWRIVFSQSASGRKSSITLGDVSFNTKTPAGGHGGVLHNVTTSIGEGWWRSVGDFKDLSISSQLLAQLGLPFDTKADKDGKPIVDKVANVVYSGQWDLDNEPTWQGKIKLKRTKGNSILPLADPVPLDFKTLQISLNENYKNVGPNQLHIDVLGQGDKSSVNAQLMLDSQFVLALRQAKIALQMTDGATLDGNIQLQPDSEQVPGLQQWQAQIQTKNLDAKGLSVGLTPASRLTTAITLNANVFDDVEIKNTQGTIRFADGSSWNKQSLRGHLKTDVDLSNVLPLPSAVDDPNIAIQSQWQNLKINATDIELQLGDNLVKGMGAWGQQQDQLNLSLNFKQLMQIWPSLSGSAQGELALGGDWRSHSIKLQGDYDAYAKQGKAVQPLSLALDLQGQAQFDKQAEKTWQGTLGQLHIAYAGTQLNLQQPLTTSIKFPSLEHKLLWSVFPSVLGLQYPDKRVARIEHEGSQGEGAAWQTKGRVDGLVLSMPLYDYLTNVMRSFSTNVVLKAPNKVSPNKELVVNGLWHLQSKEQITGQVQLTRTGASGIWPFPTPVPLDFNELDVQLEPFSVLTSSTTAEKHTDVQQGSALSQRNSIATVAAPSNNIIETMGVDQPSAETAQKALRIQAKGQGPASHLIADIVLNSDSLLGLSKANIDLSLPDKSMLRTDIKVSSQADTEDVAQAEQTSLTHIEANIETAGLALDKLTYGAVPAGQINGEIAADVIVSSVMDLQRAQLRTQFNPGSKWNGQTLKGQVDVVLEQQSSEAKGYHPMLFVVPKSDIDLTLGQNVIKSKGAFGKQGDQLSVQIKAPRLADFWPELPGGLNLESKLNGSVDNNTAELSLNFNQGKSNKIGKAPVIGKFHFAGGWGELTDGVLGWRGTISQFEVSHAGFSIEQKTPTSMVLTPMGVGDKPQWAVGASNFTLGLPGKPKVIINNGGTTGQQGKWMTQGGIKGLVLSPKLIQDIRETFGQLDDTNQRSAIIVRNKNSNQVKTNDPIFDLDWKFDFDQSLSGKAKLSYRSGDIVLPAQTPFRMGLKNFVLTLQSTAAGDNRSRVIADFKLDTDKRGSAQGSVQTVLIGLDPDLNNATSGQIKAQMENIGWLSAFTNDLLELGGRLNLDVKLNTRGGSLVTQGRIEGRELKIIEVENGIRLLDGTLDVNLNGDNIVIERLHFPAVIRVMPKEWRTNTWIKENPATQNGSLSLKGNWNLSKSSGRIDVILDHYPVLQRSDRFAMVSGQVNVDAALPKVLVRGKVTADAGWASVDIEGNAPSLDSDVVILKKGEVAPTPSPSSIDLDLDFNVDLGPRFYIVGMGVDSGLRGAITIVQQDNRLTGVGEFRTRGGAVEAYGQHLQIRRGEISFQGNLTNPVLNIEAVRTGVEVQAGVRVQGTAQRPKITLVSYPEVSEVEKLSWLIMGRGPDSGGGDLAMLFSVGSSLLGGGEPFYRKYGIDEVSVRSGDIGKTGSLLPRNTVADSVGYNRQDDLEGQFLKVAKKIKKGINVSIEQALSGSGTVARASYSLMRYLTVDLKLGTVSGIELLYQRYFRD